MLDTLIKELSQEFDMDEFVSSPEPGSYKLMFDNQIHLDVVSLNQENFLLKGSIGAYPKENVENFLIKLLEANLFGKGTRGAVIGSNEDGNLLTLSLELDYNSSYKDFKNKLEDFVNVLDFWRQELSNHR